MGEEGDRRGVEGEGGEGVESLGDGSAWTRELRRE